jgi:hypothetical protein
MYGSTRLYSASASVAFGTEAELRIYARFLSIIVAAAKFRVAAAGRKMRRLPDLEKPNLEPIGMRSIPSSAMCPNRSFELGKKSWSPV